jgi:O-6-methylguanine DNA methyltransferase
MTSSEYRTVEMDSPIGPLSIWTSPDGLLQIRFAGEEACQQESQRPTSGKKDAFCQEVVRQLRSYFDGELTEFSLRLAQVGTPFQLAVWKALQAVPYGETASYADIAHAIGRPTAVRAVGAANGANRIPIVIPCHRVIGSNGTLVGYGGGLAIKTALLALERNHVAVV